MFQTFPIHLLTSQTPKRKSYIGVCMCAYGFYFDSIFIPTYWSLLELEPHMFLLLNFTFNSRIGTLGTPKIEEQRCFPLAHLFSLHIWMSNSSQNIWDKKKWWYWEHLVEHIGKLGDLLEVRWSSPTPLPLTSNYV